MSGLGSDMSGLSLWNADKEEGPDMSSLRPRHVRAESLESG
jgi:hypothetical protein